MFDTNTEILVYKKVLVHANKGMCLVFKPNQLNDVIRNHQSEFVGISTEKSIIEGDPENSSADTEQPSEEDEGRQRRPQLFFVKLPRFRFKVYYTFCKIYFLYVEHSDTYRFEVENLRGEVICTLSVQQFIMLLDSMESHRLITVTQLTACKFIDFTTSKEVYKAEVEEEEECLASRWLSWIWPSKENPFKNTHTYFYDQAAAKEGEEQGAEEENKQEAAEEEKIAAEEEKVEENVEEEQAETEEKQNQEEGNESAEGSSVEEQPSSQSPLEETPAAKEEKEKTKKKKTKTPVAESQQPRRRRGKCNRTIYSGTVFITRNICNKDTCKRRRGRNSTICNGATNSNKKTYTRKSTTTTRITRRKQT